MSRLDDAIDQAQHTLKQAREATGQREKINLIVQAYDALYNVGVAFYHAKTIAAERKTK